MSSTRMIVTESSPATAGLMPDLAWNPLVSTVALGWASPHLPAAASGGRPAAPLQPPCGDAAPAEGSILSYSIMRLLSIIR